MDCSFDFYGLCVQGGPFADDTVLLWEELGPRLLQSQAVCLVSSPAHLERISVPGKKILSESSDSRAVFSSGGPLRVSAVDMIREQTGQSPVEVFGSTETGGIGWRQRSLRSENWTPLRGRQNLEPRVQAVFKFVLPFVSSAAGKF